MYEAGMRMPRVETVHFSDPILLLYKASVYEIVLAEILCAVCSHDAHYITSDQLIMALMIPPVQLFSSNPPQFQR